MPEPSIVTRFQVSAVDLPDGALVRFLCWKESGEIIRWLDRPMDVGPGERREIDAGRWARLDHALSAEMYGELQAGNLKIVNKKPQLIGDPTVTVERPTVQAERL